MLKQTLMFLFSPQKLCDHGDHVLHSQCDQQLRSQLQHRHAVTHDLQISKNRFHLQFRVFPITLGLIAAFFSMQGSLIANMILGIIILKKRYACFLWQQRFFSEEVKSAGWKHHDWFCLALFFACRYSASKYLSIALVSLGIFICTIMSAKQVVSPLQSCIMTMLVFICRLSLVSAYYSYFNTSRVGRVVFYSAFCLFSPPAECGQWGIRRGELLCLCALAYRRVFKCRTHFMSTCRAEVS